MATINSRAQCSMCEEETSTFICRGCSKDFCFDHLAEHRQTLNTQLHQIQNDYNLFRQTLIEQKNDSQKHPLIQEINRWEKDSIDKIRQTAKQFRQRLTNYTNKIINRIETTLDDPKEQPVPIGSKNQFNEIDLDQFRTRLEKLKEELDKPKSVSIEQQSSYPINKLLVIIPLDKETKWKQHGITIAGGNGQGNRFNQLFYPFGISIDNNESIYVADFENDRVVEWKCNATEGQIVVGGNGQGDRMNQLYGPTAVVIDQETNSFIIADRENRRVMRQSRQNTTNGEVFISNIDCTRLAMDKNGCLYVSDYIKHEVRRWRRGEKGKGTVVAGGNGEGHQLNQLNCPTSIFVDEDQSLYVADQQNHRVMKWMKNTKEGIVVAGGNDQGDSLKQLSDPRGVVVDQSGHIYVADWSNHRVMRWCQEAKQGTVVVGGNGEGHQSNQFNGPADLLFDQQGNLYVTDLDNNRIQKFEVE